MKKISLCSKPFRPIDVLLTLSDLNHCIIKSIQCRNEDDYELYIDFFYKALSHLIQIVTDTECSHEKTIKKSDKEYS